MALRHDVQSGAMNLKDKLSIELPADMRRGRVMYGGQIFSAKVPHDIIVFIKCFETNFFQYFVPKS